MVSNGWENPIIKLRRQGQNPRILPRGTTSSIDQVVTWAEVRSRCMRNDENAGDHCHLNAWTLHSLAHCCYAAFYRHHHRWWITLFRPEICHCIQWSPHQMGEPHRTEHNITHLGCLEDGNLCAFDSGIVLPNGSFTLPGLVPGRYPYLCRIHPIMHGIITVSDSSPPSQL